MSQRGSGEGGSRANNALIWRLIPRLAFTWLALLMVPVPASAEPVLTVTPAEIALTSGVPERVVVTLAGTEAELRGAHLQILPPPGLQTKNCARTTPARGTKGWIVTLQADSSLIASSAAFVVSTSPRLVTGSLKVSAAPSPAATAQFSAELIYDGESLFDKAQGDVQLRLINLSDSTLSLQSSLILPAFLTRFCGDNGKACPPDPAVTLAPRASQVVDYRIAVNSSNEHPLLSGKHQIFALVLATRLSTARPWQGSQITSREVNVGIPGLADVQALIQVPSFLLLPGFLICVVAMMTWGLWRPSAPEAGKPAAWLAVAMSPALWVLAISISMTIVWTYPRMNDLFGRGRRDLLVGFDLSDVITVWVSSIIIGFVVGNLAVAYVAARKWWKSRGQFSTGDTADDALHKMKRLQLSLNRMMVDTAATGRLFQVADADEAGKVWAIPTIRYEALTGFDDASFANALTADDIDEVVTMIDEGTTAGTLRIDWGTAAGAKGPRVVERTIFNKPDQKTLILDPI